jgi:tRNA wybutosine-synthesizing protein 1
VVASGRPFVVEDYMMETPSWAVYGAAEAGFDPEETRVRKERRHHWQEAALAGAPPA